MTIESDAPRVLVSLATYNEKDNLRPLIEEIFKYVPHAHILVVDDNSPDGTGKLADEMAEQNPQIHVIHREGKLGLGTATMRAMRYAMDEDYDLHVNMDADFSHHPRYLPAMLAGMERYDVMIGSRYVPGGGTENWPWKRKFISTSVNILSRFLLRLRPHDTSGAYRCYRVSCLRRVRLDRVLSRGYSFQEEILYRCRVAGCSMGETPIIFADRMAGSSKVNTKEAIRSIALLIWLGLLVLFGRDR